MKLSIRHTAILSAIVALGASISACSGGSSDIPPFDEQGAIGAWIEVVSQDDPARDQRQVAPTKPKKNIRKLVINSDQTFKLFVATPDGKADESKAIEGSWRIDGRKMLFEVKNQTVEEKFSGWAPIRTMGPRDIEDDKGGVVKRMVVFDNGEESTIYRKE